MFLPADRISTASIANVQTNHLLFAVDRKGALIWVVAVGDDKFAMFLTGEYAGRGFKITPDSGGSGMVVGPVQVRIDPSSLTSKDDHWNLKALDNAIAVRFQAEIPQGFAEVMWARVAQTETLPDTSFYFSRWSLGIECDAERIELVNVADGQIKTPLVPVE